MKAPSGTVRASLSLSLVVMLMAPAGAMAAATTTEKYLPPMAGQLDRSAFANSDVKPAPARANNNAPMIAAEEDEPVDRTKDLLKQALAKHGQGDMRGAEGIFKQVLAIDSRNVDANFNLGAIAEDRGDLQAASRYYGIAAASNPGDTDLSDALNSVQDKMRQQTVAKQNQEQLARKQELKKIASDAAAAYKAGKYDQAVAGLERVAAAEPNDANVQFALGQALRGKGDANRAQQHLNKAVALAPDNQLYRNAINELGKEGQQMAQQNNQPQAPAAPDYGSYDNGSAVANDPTPPGQLTPFAGNEQPLYGHAYDSTSGGRGMGIGSAMGLGGMAAGVGSLFGGRGGGVSGTRLVRNAAMGGIAGAAMGAITSGISGGRGNVKSGAMRGALYGGLMGLMTGF